VRIFFGHRCQNVDFARREAEVLDVASGAARRVAWRALIGADGAFSAVRGAMQKMDRFDFDQSYLTHAYKELTIPPSPDGSHRIEKHALHIWPRRSYMMIALPNLDGSFTCTLFAPFDGPDGIGGLRGDGDVQAYFRERFADALPMMPTLAEDFRANPAASLVTMRCFPWRVGGEAALVGDAAHAVVPFYGQGMNASFEDCVVLGDCIDKRGEDLESAFAEYESMRKPNTDALAQLALDNFVEMRDKVGDPAFLARKRREQRLSRWFPRSYVPLYSMVSFSTIPYAEAVRRAARQDEAVRLVVGVALAVLIPAGLVGAMLLVRWMGGWS
jgi:kynurenine 3-monooxygenase